MSAGRSTHRSGVATVPTLSPSTTLGQLGKLSVATLVLHLNNYHLVQDGNKAAKVQRLYSHLQSMQDIDNSSSSGSISGSPSEDEHRDDATPGVSVTGSSSTARRSRPQTTRLHSPATSEPPFTKAQQRALTATIKSALKESRQHKRPRRQHRRNDRSPTISSPSGSDPKGHSSHTASHTKNQYCRSSSSSSTSLSSGSSTSGSSPESSPDHCRHHHKSRRRHGKRRRHGRSGHHQQTSHTPPVPRKVRHAIERGEYVELNKLLIRSGSSSSRSSSTRSITGLELWLEAWSIYAAVLSSHKPQLAPQLFQYQAFITRSSSRFQLYAWLQYDTQFRLKLASNPHACWSSTDPELVATWLSADATKKKSTCFYCGSPDHMSADCPLRASSSIKHSASPCPVCNSPGHTARDCPQLAVDKHSKTGSKDDKYCRLYNRRGTCFRGSKCPYYHACSECNGGHPSRACPQAR